jgi:hypothetical protein
MRDWHARHPERHKGYSAKHHAEHPEARRTYYLKNADRISERDKLRRAANPAINRKRVAAKYGLALEEMDRLLQRPCEICGGVATDVDHDHETGLVRGALCGSCNSGIGHLNDDPDRVARAAEYLASRRPIVRLIA